MSADHYCAFGRITHAFARVEVLLSEAIRNLLSMTPMSAAVTLSQYGYEQLKSLLLSITGVVLDKEDNAHLLKLIKMISKKSALRNNVAHSVWAKGRRSGSIKPFVLKTKGKLQMLGSGHNENDWTALELHSEADSILELASAIQLFFIERKLFAQHFPK